MLANLRDRVHLVRRFINERRGRDVRFSLQSSAPLLTLGGRRASWTLTPSALRQTSIVYSVGVGTDISFDLALIERFGCEVYAFDPTPKSVAWIRRIRTPNQFRFRPWGLAAIDGTATFELRTRPDWTSYQMVVEPGKAYDVVELEVRRLTSIMTSLGHTHIDLLKMDIEGAEFEVIDDILASGARVEQLLVEFHYEYGDHAALQRLSEIIHDLQVSGLKLVARSPIGREFTFARLDS